MYWVLEYGDNIGTLKNLFRDEGQAVFFVQKMIQESTFAYVQIKPYYWHCKEKNESFQIMPAPVTAG